MSQDQVKIKNTSFVFWICLALCMASTTVDRDDSIRFIKYLIVPVSILGWIFTANTRYLINLPIVRPFLFLILSSLAMTLQAEYDELSTVLIVAAYVLPFILLKVPALNVKAINLFAIATYSTIAFDSLFVHLQVDITQSYSSAENAVFAFVFGLLSLYFFYRKKWIYVLVNIFFLVAAGKRSAVGATFLLMLLWTFIPRNILLIIFRPSIMVLGNIMVVLFLCYFSLGTFDKQVRFITGKSANEFAFGRQSLYLPFVEEMSDDVTKFMFYGDGWGSSRMILEDNFSLRKDMKNVHSDLLRLVYELGGLSFVIFIYLWYQKANAKQLFYTMYMNMIFITDNSLVYITVMFMYLIIYDLENREEL